MTIYDKYQSEQYKDRLRHSGYSVSHIWKYYVSVMESLIKEIDERACCLELQVYTSDLESSLGTLLRHAGLTFPIKWSTADLWPCETAEAFPLSKIVLYSIVS